MAALPELLMGSFGDLALLIVKCVDLDVEHFDHQHHLIEHIALGGHNIYFQLGNCADVDIRSGFKRMAKQPCIAFTQGDSDQRRGIDNHAS